MIFAPPYIDEHGVYRVKDIAAYFLETGSALDSFGEACFPEWARPIVRRCYAMRKAFNEVWTCFNERPNERDLVTQMWACHNEISNLCLDTTAALICHRVDAKTEAALRRLFNYLYDQSLKLKKIKEECGDIDDHYKTFLGGEKCVCPFCGLVNLPDPDCGYRAEYDHYLCRATYPLLGISFKNLVPICGECNPNPQKGDTDVLVDDDGNRRKVYDPYGTIGGVTATAVRTDDYSPGDNGEWQITFSPVSATEADEVQNWTIIFRMSERASARVKSHHEEWMRVFMRHRYFPNRPDVGVFRDDLRNEAQTLLEDKSLRTELNAVLKSGFFNFLADNASDPELEGWAWLADGQLVGTPVANLT